MYKEYLGEGYHDRVRKLLTADDKLCTDTMIDSDIVIGAMKKILAPYLEGGQTGFILADKKVHVENEEDFAVFQQAALYLLSGILCSPIISRDKVPPFLGFKYQKNWKKKQEKLMKKGHQALQGLTLREVDTHA